MLSTCLCVAVLLSPAQASDAGSGSSRVAELVERLRSPLHAERHQATLELKSLERSDLDALQAAYVANPDLEIRSRLQAAAEGILFREALAGMGGFMGIGLRDMPAGSSPNLPPDQRAIQVTRVMPDTGAEAAGLRVNDLIVELNGERLPINGTQADFISSIKDRPPGEVIFLVLVRDGEYIHKDVMLGLRPKSAIDTRDENEHRALLDQATRDFAEWCRSSERKADVSDIK